MSCILNRGKSLGCSTIAGVEKVWLGTYDADAVYTIDANGIVTSVTGATGVYLFEQDMEYAGFNQPATITRENGTVFFQSDLNLKFIDLDADLIELTLKLVNAPLYAVFLSNSGNYFIAGVESAGRATESQLSLGVAMGDLNGSTLTITFKGKHGAYALTPSLLGTDIPILG